jgi:hypothetical protein
MAMAMVVEVGLLLVNQGATIAEVQEVETEAETEAETEVPGEVIISSSIRSSSKCETVK